jgi:N-dimethylarginine dimethylaminohydrolase
MCVDEPEGGRSLTSASRRALAGAGLEVRAIELDAIEAGGGSLRCCIGEVF